MATQLLVETDAGAERFDRVVSTLATRLTARLVPELPQAWRDRHEWGRAYGAHCVVLALDRPLTSAYWLNMNDPGYPFMALVEHTNYQPPADYGGRHLIYLGNYRPMDDPLMTAPRDAVLDEFLPHLERLNPEFDRSWVTDAWTFAAPVRAADRDGRLPRPHPAVRNADPELLGREHVPGLPARPRSELLDRPCRTAGGALGCLIRHHCA